jgi:hypothetical protein
VEWDRAERVDHRTTAGRLLPTWAKSATVAQVVAIAAGILAMASEVLMWRDVGYTLAVYASSANPVPERGYLLSFAPAGAGVLVAIVALTLRGRARWLHYPQIGLWILTLASSVYIAHVGAPVTGPGPLYGPLLVGDIPGVITIALLTLNLRRPASWHVAFVLAAAAVPLSCGCLRRPHLRAGLRHSHRDRHAMHAG